MEAVKRYDIYLAGCDEDVILITDEDEEGEWVKFEDYEKLKKLFKRYVQLIVHCEGVNYVDYCNDDLKDSFTDEEKEIIQNL